MISRFVMNISQVFVMSLGIVTKSLQGLLTPLVRPHLPTGQVERMLFSLLDHSKADLIHALRPTHQPVSSLRYLHRPLVNRVWGQAELLPINCRGQILETRHFTILSFRPCIAGTRQRKRNFNRPSTSTAGSAQLSGGDNNHSNPVSLPRRRKKASSGTSSTSHVGLIILSKNRTG